MIREILLVHHSHTDVGYTHPQPVIFELHRRFIDHALQLADETCEWPEECRFRWTCEVSGITLDWWQRAGPDDRRRFREAIERGQFEAAGLAWNITPLADDRMLLRMLEGAELLRAEGIPVRAAMNSDVNGVPWGLVDALLDHGIPCLSMGVNEHYGYAPQPRPRGFHWESPTGRTLLVWNGLQYWNAANIQMRIPESLDAVAEAMPPFLQVWEQRGYPYPFLPVQITTASAPDNAGPDPRLPAFVRDWNASSPDVRMRLVTLSNIFDRLRREDLPTMRGDWTDWWNFGSGSTARETTLALEGQRLLGSAAQIRAWPGKSFPNEDTQHTETAQALALYVEHTWGADRSVSISDSWETSAQLNQKLGYAYQGYLGARMLRRDGLERLAQYAGGDALTALFYNPLPFPIRRTVRIPSENGEFHYLSEPALHLPHRQDVALADLPDPTPGETQSRWIGPLEFPALGYVAWPYEPPGLSQSDLTAGENEIGNGRVAVRFVSGRAGIASLTLDGVEYARSLDDSLFAEPLSERPAGGQRGELFGPLDWRALDVHRQWKPNWDAVRERPARFLGCRHALPGGCAEYQQSVEMATGDRLTLTYRVFPDEPNVELSVVMQKRPLSIPHALYLPLPLDMSPSMAQCHFATAGAVVALDKEQIPYASRHYVTTQRFIRMQGDSKGLTVACPDAPLWQIGGFSFGRHHEGEVLRESATLIAWLTNNYWDVNFCADQGGTLRFRFRLLPHPRQPLADSIRQALVYDMEPQPHIYQHRGPVRHQSAQLLHIDPAGAILTGLEPDGDALTLTLLNPSDDCQAVQIASGVFAISRAARTDLAGGQAHELPVSGGRTHFSVPPRAWVGLRLSPLEGSSRQSGERPRDLLPGITSEEDEAGNHL